MDRKIAPWVIYWEDPWCDVTLTPPLGGAWMVTEPPDSNEVFRLGHFRVQTFSDKTWGNVGDGWSEAPRRLRVALNPPYCAWFHHFS